MQFIVMTITRYQNKTLYNKVFYFEKKNTVTDMLMFSGIPRTKYKANNANKVVQYDT